VGLTRAVLVIPRDSFHPGSQRLRLAVDAAKAQGLEVTAVVDPADSRRAHELVAAGEVDCIAYGRPGDLPTVVMLATPGRTVPLPRDEDTPLSLRRPQLVERTQPVDRGSSFAPVEETPPVRRRASDRSLRRTRTR
jgi:hypothetical protein